MGSGEKGGDGPKSSSTCYYASKVSRAFCPAHLRRSLVIQKNVPRPASRESLYALVKRILLRAVIPPTRFASLPSTPRPQPTARANERMLPQREPTLPETPMPAEPLIRVLETFDLSLTDDERLVDVRLSRQREDSTHA